MIVRTLLVGKSPWIGATLAGLFGVGAESTGLTHAGNTAIFVALCGLAGAFFASLPKIIAARSNAKLSESEFIGKETREMIKILRKDKLDNERIIALQTSVRHLVQEAYQAAVWRIDLLCDIAKKHGDIPPPYMPLNVGELLKEMDQTISEIKAEKPT